VQGFCVARETLTAAFLEDQGLHFGQFSLPLQELLSTEIRQGPQPVSTAAPCGGRRGNKSLTMQKIGSGEVLMMSTANNQERSLCKNVQLLKCCYSFLEDLFWLC